MNLDVSMLTELLQVIGQMKIDHDEQIKLKDEEIERLKKDIGIVNKHKTQRFSCVVDLEMPYDFDPKQKENYNKMIKLEARRKLQLSLPVFEEVKNGCYVCWAFVLDPTKVKEGYVEAEPIQIDFWRQNE
jgi:hypothetical protein